MREVLPCHHLLLGDLLHSLRPAFVRSGPTSPDLVTVHGATSSSAQWGPTAHTGTSGDSLKPQANHNRRVSRKRVPRWGAMLVVRAVSREWAPDCVTGASSGRLCRFCFQAGQYLQSLLGCGCGLLNVAAVPKAKWGDGRWVPSSSGRPQPHSVQSRGPQVEFSGEHPRVTC